MEVVNQSQKTDPFIHDSSSLNSLQFPGVGEGEREGGREGEREGEGEGERGRERERVTGSIIS